MSKSITGSGSLNLTLNELRLLEIKATKVEAVNATISSQLNGNNATFTGTVSVGNLAITGTFTVVNLTSSGLIDANNITASGVITTENLTVDAAATFNGVVSLTSLAESSGSEELPILVQDSTNEIKKGAAATFIPSTGTMKATTFQGDLTGDVTGGVTGNVLGDLIGNVTGNVTGDVTGNVTGDVTGGVVTLPNLSALAVPFLNASNQLTTDSINLHFNPSTHVLYSKKLKAVEVQIDSMNATLDLSSQTYYPLAYNTANDRLHRFNGLTWENFTNTLACANMNCSGNVVGSIVAANTHAVINPINEGGSGNFDVLFSNATNQVSIDSNGAFRFNPSAATLSTGNVAVSGNITCNATGAGAITAKTITLQGVGIDGSGFDGPICRFNANGKIVKSQYIDDVNQTGDRRLTYNENSQTFKSPNVTVSGTLTGSGDVYVSPDSVGNASTSSHELLAIDSSGKVLKGGIYLSYLPADSLLRAQNLGLSGTADTYGVQIKALSLNYTQVFSASAHDTSTGTWGGGDYVKWNAAPSTAQEYGVQTSGASPSAVGGAWNVKTSQGIMSLSSNNYSGTWRITINITWKNNASGGSNRMTPRIQMYKNNQFLPAFGESVQYLRMDRGRFANLMITGVTNVSGTSDAFKVATHLNIGAATAFSSTTSNWEGGRIQVEFQYLGDLTEYAF